MCSLAERQTARQNCASADPIPLSAGARAAKINFFRTLSLKNVFGRCRLLVADLFRFAKLLIFVRPVYWLGPLNKWYILRMLRPAEIPDYRVRIKCRFFCFVGIPSAQRTDPQGAAKSFEVSVFFADAAQSCNHWVILFQFRDRRRAQRKAARSIFFIK